VEGSGRGLIPGITPEFAGKTEEDHESLSRNSRSPVRDLKPGPPEYEAGLLTTRARRSFVFFLR
jgi:hypothetical protein